MPHCEYQQLSLIGEQIEGQRAAQAQAQQENAVLSKVEKIRIDQTRRANALEAEANVEETKACLQSATLEHTLHIILYMHSILQAKIV